MTGTEPAGSCFLSQSFVDYIRTVLTKTQYKYWYDYIINDMTLTDISIKYDVHITTVCRVVKNARRRINAAYSLLVKGVQVNG